MPEKCPKQAVTLHERFLRTTSQEYYDLLLKVSSNGEWREWIGFFLRAVSEQSEDAVEVEAAAGTWQNYMQVARGKRLAPTGRSTGGLGRNETGD